MGLKRKTHLPEEGQGCGWVEVAERTYQYQVTTSTHRDFGSHLCCITTDTVYMKAILGTHCGFFFFRNKKLYRGAPAHAYGDLWWPRWPSLGG